MKLFSKMFALSYDEEQAAIINTLAEELFCICKGDIGFENQCCFISKYLNKNGIRFVNQLKSFIDLREAKDEQR